MKVVVKIGGSLMDCAQQIVRRLDEHIRSPDCGSDRFVVIVPGGGPFADRVRAIQERFDTGDEAAHWMAVLAMEQYAHLLMDGVGVGIVTSLDDVRPGLSVVLPYNLLRRSDELEHSWDVTSDTIAAWVASRIGADLVKVTDVDGVFDQDGLVRSIDAQRLEDMGESCVDRSLPRFLIQHRMDCHVVNGRHADRIIDAIERRAVVGTYITVSPNKKSIDYRIP
ncbi:MAG: amino acid kinase [Euryarchaeota archaeon]|nr:amino acid kinase [Euryarchaeota archaeon]